MHVVMLVYPKLTQLDLTGPFEILARFPELKIDLAWKTVAPVVDGMGLRLTPTVSFAECDPADILFVPGGPGQLPLMEDTETLDFLRLHGSKASWITSVCTGSLVLAAAGLLTGYRATCHWLSLGQLAHFGVHPVAERVVRDRNRITGAGVTSGIDFGLVLAAELFGRDRAREVQLAVEYDPAPPFADGGLRTADPRIVERIRRSSADFQKRREEVAVRVAQTLNSRRVTDV